MYNFVPHKLPPDEGVDGIGIVDHRESARDPSSGTYRAPQSSATNQTHTDPAVSIAACFSTTIVVPRAQEVTDKGLLFHAHSRVHYLVPGLTLSVLLS